MASDGVGGDLCKPRRGTGPRQNCRLFPGDDMGGPLGVPLMIVRKADKLAARQAGGQETFAGERTPLGRIEPPPSAHRLDGPIGEGAIGGKMSFPHVLVATFRPHREPRTRPERRRERRVGLVDSGGPC